MNAQIYSDDRIILITVCTVIVMFALVGAFIRIRRWLNNARIRSTEAYIKALEHDEVTGKGGNDVTEQLAVLYDELSNLKSKKL